MSADIVDVNKLSPAKKALYERLMESNEALSDSEQGLVTGPLPITPNQLDEFSIVNPDRHIFNMPLLLEIENPYPKELLEAVVHALLSHHDALRLSSVQAEGEWVQSISSIRTGPLVLHYDLLSYSDENEKISAVEAIVQEIQFSFNLQKGPLFKVAQIVLGKNQSARLFIVAHHMACDQYSANIILQDFFTAVKQVLEKTPISLPKKTTSLINWSNRLRLYSNDAFVQSQTGYWQGLCDRKYIKLPVDSVQKINLGCDVATTTLEKNRNSLKALEADYIRGFKLQLEHVVLAACSIVLANWKNDEHVRIAMLHHGRAHPFNDVDLSRTVGWFSYLYPLSLSVNEDEDDLSVTRIIKKQYEEVPANGFGHGLLKHFSQRADVVESLSTAECDIFLNIQFGFEALEAGVLTLAKESTGIADSQSIQRPMNIYLNIHVLEKTILMSCAYNKKMYQMDTINNFLSLVFEKIHSIDSLMIAKKEQRIDHA